MADEKVIGGGVGGLNTGDSGINDGTSGDGGSVGGGGSSTSSSSGVVTPSSTSGTSGSSGVGNESSDDQELVEDVVKKYLALSAIGLTYEQLVPIYVDNKLGFAGLKAEYKKDNPDLDPKDIDAAVDEERAKAIEEFTTEGSTAKDELKKKYDDFQTSLATVKKDLSSIVTEFAKTMTEAVMPTTIGVGAPNPVSISLKVINGITKIKKILDRVFAALAVFMASAKALGLDGTDGYDDIISAIARPLRVIQNLISKKEADESYQENLALQNYLQTAKENWPYGVALGIDYETVEDWGGAGLGLRIGWLTIHQWPMDSETRADVQEIYNIYSKELDKGRLSDAKKVRMSKFEAILKYNDYLSWAIEEFKKNYKLVADEDQGDNNTDTASIPSYEELSSSGTSGSSGSSGGNNNNTGNFIQKFTRALFKRING